MRHTTLARAGGVAATALLTILIATPASAEIDGPCTASGAFYAGAVAEGEPAVVVDASSSSTYEIPPSGIVDWDGAVQRGGEARDYNGFITIDTSVDDLFEFLSVDKDLNIWGGTNETGNDESGLETYDVDTGLIPGGAEIVVAGQHTDDGGTVICTGSVTLTLAGSPWSSPTTIASAAGAAILLLLAFILALRGLAVGKPLSVAGTAMFGLFAGLFLGLVATGSVIALILAVLGAIVGGAAAVMTKRNGSTLVSGHPTAGWSLGLLGGLFLAVLGWAIGLYPLSSPMLLAVPLVMMILGFIAGLAAPLKSASRA